MCSTWFALVFENSQGVVEGQQFDQEANQNNASTVDVFARQSNTLNLKSSGIDVDFTI